MHLIDLLILFIYLIGTMLFGVYFSRSQKDVKTYFVGSQHVPWWAIMASIVSTETSSVTFISVPGFAFTGNFTFLQLVMGYLIGRLMVSLLFIPQYFRGELLTVYQLLGQRFGPEVRRLASSLFLITRSLADGFRLYLTGLVLAAVLLALPGTEETARAWFPALNPTVTIIIFSVMIMGVATIVFSYLGGMSAVIWTDVSQLGIYLIGAIVAAAILLERIPGGWHEVAQVGMDAGKFTLFDFTSGLTKSYTFWSGLIGGAFLTTATHGTDQLMVQRYLCSDSPRSARIALLTSGVVVFVQFALFLLIGVMLYVFYNFHAAAQMAAFTNNGVVQGDRIFPHFIVSQLPTGVVGLVIAAIAAAAFTSSLNSQAATAMADFYMPMTGYRKSEHHYLNASRIITAVWGLVQIVVGIIAIKLSQRVVDEVLGIASFTNGVILGVFFLGTFTKQVRQNAAIAGMVAGALVMLAVRLFTGISWQWYVLIGSLATYVVGYLASQFSLGTATAESSGNENVDTETMEHR
ncbi:MAG: sodium:solute symporter [Blastocatellia bacterium]|nr:sodium:solute symporter [Blastocatellia bacterium]